MARGSEFVEVLQNRREAILHAWARSVEDHLSTPPLTRSELVDHIPTFLKELADTLSRGSWANPEARTGVAASHGAHRFRLGFDLASVVREYGELHRCILQEVAAARIAPTVEEMVVLSNHITIAISDAVTQYAGQRDSELRRQANEHFAFVAHELRTPLNSAQLAVHALREARRLEGGLGDVLVRSMGRLRALIDGALHLALEGSRLEPRLQKLSLGKLVAEIGDDVALDAAEKGVELRLSVSDDADDLEADPRLIKSALRNIVGNAVKFSDRGSVVHVRGKSTNDEVRLEVQDHGGGIPADKLQKIFLPFVQEGGDRTGFGLGLAIAKQAVEAHGGTVSVNSALGEGSTLTILMPRHVNEFLTRRGPDI